MDPKRYIFESFDVVEAARRRMISILRSFDVVVSSFSGGKDSLAMVMLMTDLAESLGIKPYVLFVDEEFMPTHIVDFVHWFMYESRYAKRIIPLWSCFQLESSIYCANSMRKVIQWSPEREWTRQPPDDALMDPTTIYDIYGMAIPISKLFKGRSVALLLGTRTEESISRLTTIVRSGRKKVMPCYLQKTKAASVFHARPIYDWKTNDIFKYLQGKGIINPLYYALILACKKKSELRSGTPLWGKHCNLAAYKKIDPKLYGRLVQLFPEVHAAGIYNTATKPSMQVVDEMGDKYGRTWEGCFAYIDAEIEPEYRKLARKIVQKAAREIYSHNYKKRLTAGVSLRKTWGLLVKRNFEHAADVGRPSPADLAWEKNSCAINDLAIF